MYDKYTEQWVAIAWIRVEIRSVLLLINQSPKWFMLCISKHENVNRLRIDCFLVPKSVLKLIHFGSKRRKGFILVSKSFEELS